MTKIVLIAKDRLYRAGLGRLIDGTRFDLVAAGASVTEAAQHDANLEPDLILFNVDIGCTDIQQLIGQARSWARQARVVVIAPVGCSDILNQGVAAGADGTLHRDISAEALIDVLAVVMSGEPVFLGLHLSGLRPGSATDGRESVPGPAAGPLDRLSQRERMVLQFLSLGLSNKELARNLSISENTVKVHVRRICRLLGVQNRTQAALIGAKHSVVDPAETAKANGVGLPRGSIKVLSPDKVLSKHEPIRIR